MRYITTLFIFLFLPTLGYPSNPEAPDVNVCFTPGESCEQIIISAINHAKKRVYVQAYSFTANYIANALIAAHKREVDVRLILDRSWLKQPKKNRAIMSMYQNDILIWIDAEPAIAHNKIMIIDDDKVITGSYNFTIAAARHNTENVLLISSENIAEQYLENWSDRLKISKPLPAYNKPAEFEKFRNEIGAKK